MEDRELIPVALVGDDLMVAHSAMAKFRMVPGFQSEYNALTAQERARFAQAWRTINDTLNATGQLPAPPLVEKMVGRTTGGHHPQPIYEVRWDNSSVHKRASFHLEADVQGDPIVAWRHIGTHQDVYNNP